MKNDLNVYNIDVFIPSTLTSKHCFQDAMELAYSSNRHIKDNMCNIHQKIGTITLFIKSETQRRLTCQDDLGMKHSLTQICLPHKFMHF